MADKQIPFMRQNRHITAAYSTEAEQEHKYPLGSSLWSTLAKMDEGRQGICTTQDVPVAPDFLQLRRSTVNYMTSAGIKHAILYSRTPSTADNRAFRVSGHACNCGYQLEHLHRHS